MLEQPQNLATGNKSKKTRPPVWIWALALAVLVALAVGIVIILNQKGKPTSTYEDTDAKATAAFEIDVDYRRNCKDQKDCDPNKPDFSNAKIFVFDKNGNQVRVVRADDKGIFTASMPEGDYILLTAKTFEGKQTMPQETVTLKNGKVLKLKADYGTEKQ